MGAAASATPPFVDLSTFRSLCAVYESAPASASDAELLATLRRALLQPLPLLIASSSQELVGAAERAVGAHLAIDLESTLGSLLGEFYFTEWVFGKAGPGPVGAQLFGLLLEIRDYKLARGSGAAGGSRSRTDGRSNSRGGNAKDAAAAAAAVTGLPGGDDDDDDDVDGRMHRARRGRTILRRFDALELRLAALVDVAERVGRAEEGGGSNEGEDEEEENASLWPPSLFDRVQAEAKAAMTRDGHFDAFQRSAEHHALTTELRASLAGEHGRLGSKVLAGASPEVVAATVAGSTGEREAGGARGGSSSKRGSPLTALQRGLEAEQEVEVAPWLRKGVAGTDAGGLAGGILSAGVGDSGGGGGVGVAASKQRKSLSIAMRHSISKTNAAMVAGAAKADERNGEASLGGGNGTSSSPLRSPSTSPRQQRQQHQHRPRQRRHNSDRLASSSGGGLSSLALGVVLADKLGLFLFKSFCRTQFEEESLLYCLEAAALHRLLADGRRDGGCISSAAAGAGAVGSTAGAAAAPGVGVEVEAQERARRMFEKYIAAGAKLELRAGAVARARVTRALLECATAQDHGATAAPAATDELLAALEAVRAERWSFLERDLWPRCANSTLLKGWTPKLRARLEEAEWRQAEREQLDAAKLELARVAETSGLSNSFSFGPGEGGGGNGAHRALHAALAAAVDEVPATVTD